MSDYLTIEVIIASAVAWEICDESSQFVVTLKDNVRINLDFSRFDSNILSAICRVVRSNPSHARAQKVLYTYDFHTHDYHLITDEFSPVYIKELTKVMSYDLHTGLTDIECVAYATSPVSMRAQVVYAKHTLYMAALSDQWFEHYYPGCIKRLTCALELGVSAEECAQIVIGKTHIAKSALLPELMF